MTPETTPDTCPVTVYPSWDRHANHSHVCGRATKGTGPITGLPLCGVHLNAEVAKEAKEGRQDRQQARIEALRQAGIPILGGYFGTDGHVTVSMAMLEQLAAELVALRAAAGGQS